MNILIIPSWFGDNESPNAGIFFKDEATLVASSNYVILMVFDRVSVTETSMNEDTEIEYSIKSKPINNRLTIIRVKLPFNEKLCWEDNIKAFQPHVFKVFDTIYHKFKVDIIHAYATFYGGIFAHWISTAYHIPYIITEHFGPFNPDFLHSNYVKNEMIEAINESNSFICVSTHLRQQILMQGILRDSLVIGNYVNDKLFQINDKSSEDNLLLTVAYYPSYIKDIKTLMEAYSILVKQGLDFKAIIVGGGEIKGGYHGYNPVTDMVSEFNLTQYVRVIGSVSHNEMARLMQKCSFYISSSIAETFGVSICEAMLCGKPCVVTKNGGSMDFTNENNSIVVDIHQPRELAAGIIRMMTNRKNFNPNTIRKHIVQKYGTETFLRKINEIYSLTMNTYAEH